MNKNLNNFKYEYMNIRHDLITTIITSGRAENKNLTPAQIIKEADVYFTFITKGKSD